jgi:hypothetical protein
MIPASERAKIVHALGRTATVIIIIIIIIICLFVCLLIGINMFLLQCLPLISFDFM